MGDTDTVKEPPMASPTATPPVEAAEPVTPKADAEMPSLSEAIPFGNWLASGKSWGTSFMQTAKDKTMSTIELVKKDINEFTDTVTQEATAIASATTDAVKQQAQLFQQFVNTPDGEEEGTLPADFRTEAEKQEFADLEAKSGTPSASGMSLSNSIGMGWMKSLVDTVQKMAGEDTTKDEHLFTEKITVGPIRRSTLSAHELLQIQNDEKTFVTPPEKHVKLYEEWVVDFKISEYNGEINLLLSNNPRLRELYATVVPSEVDNHTFWNRYFFKVHMTEQDKLNKQQLSVNVKSPKKGDEKKTTPDGSDGSGDRDETWSMCSSTHDQLNELPDEVSDVEPAGPVTPRATETEMPEGWEDCAPSDAAAKEKAESKA